MLTEPKRLQWELFSNNDLQFIGRYRNSINGSFFGIKTDLIRGLGIHIRIFGLKFWKFDHQNTYGDSSICFHLHEVQNLHGLRTIHVYWFHWNWWLEWRLHIHEASALPMTKDVVEPLKLHLAISCSSSLHCSPWCVSICIPRRTSDYHQNYSTERGR